MDKESNRKIWEAVFLHYFLPLRETIGMKEIEETAKYMAKLAEKYDPRTLGQRRR